LNYAYIAFLVAAMGALCGMQVQEWRMQGRMAALKAEHAGHVAAAQAAQRALELHFNDQLQRAHDEAALRQAQLRHDAAGAGDAAGRLRQQLQALRGQLASAKSANSACASVDAAAAATDLLAACAARYSELAAIADRHALDAVTCQQAWPAAQ